MENDSRRRIFTRCNQTAFNFYIYCKEMLWKTKIFEFHLRINTRDSFVIETNKFLKAFFTYNRFLDFFFFLVFRIVSHFLSQTHILTFLMATFIQSHSISYVLFTHSLGLALVFLTTYLTPSHCISHSTFLNVREEVNQSYSHLIPFLSFTHSHSLLFFILSPYIHYFTPSRLLYYSFLSYSLFSCLSDSLRLIRSHSHALIRFLFPLLFFLSLSHTNSLSLLSISFTIWP